MLSHESTIASHEGRMRDLEDVNQLQNNELTDVNEDISNINWEVETLDMDLGTLTAEVEDLVADLNSK